MRLVLRATWCQHLCASTCRLTQQEEHDFAVEVFNTVRSAYKRGFLSTLKGKNKEQQRALKQQRDVYEGKLQTARQAAVVSEERLRRDAVRSAEEAQAFREKVSQLLVLLLHTGEMRDALRICEALYGSADSS
jgi:hypothetical protein